MADLERRPPTRPIRHPSTVGSDPIIGLDERNDCALRVRAPPTLLRPDQPSPATEAREIDEFDLDTTVSPHPPSTARTQRARRSAGDRDVKPSRPVTNTFDVDVGQADKQFAHARRVGLQQGLLGFWLRKTHPDSLGP